jgi:hypothetical protein
MKCLQAATWSLTLADTGTLYLAGTYTADADRAIYVNFTAKGNGDFASGFWTFITFATMTRAPYEETVHKIYGGAFGFYEHEDNDTTWWGQTCENESSMWVRPSKMLLVKAGDVINFYVSCPIQNLITADGIIEFFGTETLAEIAAAMRVEMDASSTQLTAILEDTGTTLPTTLADILTDTGTDIPASIAALPTVIEIMAGIVEDTITLAEAHRIEMAGLAGILTGAGTGTLRFWSMDGLVARITATVDAQCNRTNIVKDVTD